MRDPGHALYRAPGAPYPAGQPDAAVSAVPDNHRRRIAQFTVRELDIYANQLTRCLQALGLDAPIRADIQCELDAVRAEQDTRAVGNPGRPPLVSGLTPDELHRTRRELLASLALARPGSPSRRLILAHLSAIDAELAKEVEPAGEPGPGSPRA